MDVLRRKRNKKNKILNCSFICYVYIIAWVVKLLGVAELGGVLRKEVNEELLV